MLKKAIATLLLAGSLASPCLAQALSPTIALPYGGRTQISQGAGLLSFFQQDVDMRGLFLGASAPVTGTQWVHPCPFQGYAMLIIAPRAELEHVKDGKLFSEVQVSWNSYKWEDVLPIDAVDSCYKGDDPKMKAAAHVRQLTDKDPAWKSLREGYIYFVDLSRYDTPGVYEFTVRCDIPAGVIKQLTSIPGISQVLQLLGQNGEMQLLPGKSGHYQALSSQYVMFQHYDGNGSYADFIDFETKSVAWYQTGDPNAPSPGLFFGGIDPRDYLRQRSGYAPRPAAGTRTLDTRDPKPALPKQAYTVTQPTSDPNSLMVTNLSAARLTVVCVDGKGRRCQQDIPADCALPLSLAPGATFQVYCWKVSTAEKPEVRRYGAGDTN